jgi:hypothetical protein
MSIPAPVDNPPWAYNRNAEGPVVIECPYSVPEDADFVARIRYVGDRGLLGEVSSGSRVGAIENALELLLDKGLLNKVPVSITNVGPDYRTV